VIGRHFCLQKTAGGVRMKHLLLTLAILVTICTASMAAQQVSGTVSDERGDPIAGVNIAIDGTPTGVTTGIDGDFALTLDLASARHVTFTHVAYRPVMIKVTNADPIAVVMTPTVYPIQGITVSGDRATLGKTPIAFTDFTTGEIKRDYQIGEFPLLLETTPNVYAYADAGGGLGYSYLKIRGFDDKRVSVYVNSVPLNDPEDQATYFADIPDFAASVKDIQIQRGIGKSLYGDASFGGAVNIVSGGLEQQRQITISSGYGGFWHNGAYIGDMQKQSLEYRSGLIDGKWNLSGRYSRQLSDGYRKDSWYDGWAYYLSVARLDPKITSTFNVYGGPMKMHLAYYGISRQQEEQDRRSNPLTYDNETDNFNQPHYELHNEIKLGSNLTMHSTLYHINGNGYYEQYKDGRSFADYNIPPQYVISPQGDTVDVIMNGDLVRQQWVNKNQWGWNPSLELTHKRGRLQIGGSFYYFNSEHWGQVVWAEGVTNKITPRHRYYEYFGKKYLASLFAADDYRLSDRLNLMANLQFRHQTYSFDQNKLGAFAGYNYEVNWDFISPRLGLTYAINDKMNALFSYSLSQRAPADYEIYDAGNPSAVPSLNITSIHRTSAQDSSIVFGDPTSKAELVHDFEMGVNYRDQRQLHSINLYWMEFRNEIVQNGGINPDLGLPITTNVDRSVHAGVEVSSTFEPHKRVRLSGNLSYSYNRIKSYSVEEEVYDNDQDWNSVGYQRFNYDGKTISGFPDYIGNVIAEYVADRLHLTWRSRFIGRIYVENSNRRDLSIAPFFTSSVSASVSIGNLFHLGNLELATRVDNLFSKRYEASGYGGVTRFRDVPSQYWAEYFPAAERSFFTTLKLELQ
jgi:iron complex outermembrane recepter protein